MADEDEVAGVVCVSTVVWVRVLDGVGGRGGKC